MNGYRSGKFLAVLTVLVLALTAIPVSLAQGTEVSQKIEQALLDKFAAEGTADFIVRFTEQADLSPAYQMSWKERGEFVVNALTAAAQRSQGRAKALLDARGLRYHTFIAGNELYVWKGDLASAQALATLPEVYFIRATRTYYIDPLVSSEPNSSPQAFAWGILDTNADDFWAQFGVQGDGIVVSNIDTGVQWNHPALDQAYKCPGDPGNPACWYDPSGICPGGTPCDNNGHGTHTMGTMVGDDDPSLPYQVGMAPNAQFIMCKGCEYNTCSDFALNACADWILQPGGNPANRPHVVNNSWGGGGCDTWYLAKVQAWRAAGVFPAFSAGNSGSACNTLGSPGDYQESFGSAAHDSSRNIASFSSRGPSCFGHDPYTKPNISAPGVGVMSSVPTNSWASYSGTSMASPHSAGAVALLWSCNPGLVGQIDATFQLLQNNADTPPAGNCGAPPDNEGNYTYGYGYLNVYQAGMQGCGALAFGYLHGHVYDAATNNPIGGASVVAVPGGAIMAVTDPNGYYTMSLIPGTYDVTASKAGYAPQTVQDILIVTDTVTTQDFYLVWQGQWTLLPQSPFQYTRFDCVWFDDGTGPSTYNQKVYCPGGRTGSTTEDPSIWRFDPTTQTWSDTGHDVYEDVSNYTANILCDENCANNGPAIYIVGGYDAEGGGYTNYVQRYYPRTGTVQNVSTDPWPVTIGGYGTIPGACVNTPDQSKIYCFGAWESNAAPYFSNQTWEYDPARPAGSRWQRITTANLSVARGYIFAAVQGNYIYAIGGDYQYTGTDLVPTNVVERLDLTNLAAGWQLLTPMPVALSQGRAFGLDVDTLGLNVPTGKVWTAGGGDWPAETTEAMEYDVASNAWNQGFSDLNIARRNHAGVFIPLCTPDDPTDLMPSLLVVGGRSGSDAPPFPQPEYFPFTCAVAGPPVASFDSNSPVCLGETMVFTDTSQATPPVTAWFWDFGDGGTSNVQNPTHNYGAAGDFVVTLVVTNSEGSDSVTGTVTVNPLPLASFDYSPASGLVPLTVYFTNTSQYAQNPTWDFGDGSPPATGNYVNHTYTISGTYNVVLTVESPYGCGTVTATAQVHAYLQPVPPTAAFTADPTEGCVPLQVSFTDQSTGYPPVTEWFWDFGDGGTSTETNPVHTYNSAGNFVVTLVVTNSQGSDSVTGTIAVYPLPLASFDYNPASGPAPLTVYFTNTSQYAVTPTWSFGDGTYGAGDTVSHTYNLPGTYTVVLTVTSPYGCGEATATAQVEVLPGGYYLVADFTAAPTEGCVPLEVSFTDQSQGNPPIVSWLWDFGDGGTSTETNPVHTYNSAGTYEVVLTVDNISFTASTTGTITVYPLPDASFDYNPASGPAPLTVYFTNTSQYAQNPTWSFGDGTYGAGDTVSHTYNLPGTYTVVLTVTSPYGCGTDTATAQVRVFPTHYLVADFRADPAEGCVPLEVTFTDQSQGNPPIVSWLWDFGDGETSTETNPVHTYNSAGTYEVVLTVDNISFTASTTGTIVVYPLPLASFDYSPVSGTAPLTVYFTNTSQYAQNPTWNFGDGGTGVGDVISHTYVVAGTFSVTLTVGSPYGCGTSMATHSVVVRPAERRYYIYLPLVFKGY